MVGFNHAIKPNQQACFKLNNQTDPIKEAEFPDLYSPLLDSLPDFDFIDDWIIDNNDSSLTMSIESELKISDFEISVGKEEALIEEEMGKVSLVGASEISANQNMPLAYEVLDELKAKDNEVVDVENGFTLVKEDEGVIEKNAVTGEEDSSSSSSDSESDSESGSSSSASSSSSSSSGEEVDAVEVEEGEIKDFDPEEIFAGSDEDEPGLKGPIKSKNEIEYLPPVPPVDVKLEAHHQTLPVGVVLSIMGAKVVVEGVENHNPLNEGSILWITETRTPLGIVDEIFGPVKNPYYIVRFNSEDEVPSGICQGTNVSFVADFADHVLNDKSLYKKGYDASGENDEEIDDEIEFSDDEKEAGFACFLCVCDS